ncbi:MAG: hypothetical protein OXR84_03525 [Magnetovibrio sp.]|nr:hypothetical protein [Magnetovibrio sp.]
MRDKRISGFRVSAGLMLMALAGCGPVVATGIPAVGQADILTVVGTDKTMVDHVISMSSGKDCSYVRVERGMHYCKEDEPKVNPEVYCYNTLGSVTCYNRPDPYEGRYQKLGDNDHNLVKRTPQRQ